MRAITILLTLTAAAPAFVRGVPARADGDVLRSCFSPNGTAVSCPVDLVKGRDYLLFRHGDGTAGRVELVNPAGAVTVSLDPQALEGGVGREFRAALQGTFRIRVTPLPKELYDLTSAELATDCRAGATPRGPSGTGAPPLPKELYALPSAERATDCGAGAKTQCAIAPGAGVRGARSLGGDADWSRAALSAGRTYTFPCDAGYARLA